MNDHTPSAYKWIALTITTVGAFMAPFDGSVVIVAIPSIARSMSLDLATVLWIPLAYLLSLTVLLINFGRLGDLKGRRNFYLLGLALFSTTSVMCGMAQTGLQLITFRALQGVAASLLISNSPAIVTEVFPRTERGKALGINVMAVYGGLTLGPVIGGLIVQNLGWRWIFYINLPIGLLTALAGYLFLHETKRTKEQSFDLAGSAALAISLSSALVGLTFGPLNGWIALTTVILLASSFVFMMIFVIVESRFAESPTLDVGLFLRNRLFTAANFTALLNYIALFGVMFLVSIYLQQVLRLSPEATGLLLIPMPLTMTVVSPVSGYLSDKIGSRPLSSLGMAIISISLLWTTGLTERSTAVDVIYRLILLGLGMGLFSSPNTSAVMGSVPRTMLGVAAGTIGTMRFMGQALSLAILGAITTASMPQSAILILFAGSQASLSASKNFLAGMHNAVALASLLGAAGVFTSLVRGSERTGK